MNLRGQSPDLYRLREAPRGEDSIPTPGLAAAPPQAAARTARERRGRSGAAHRLRPTIGKEGGKGWIYDLVERYHPACLRENKSGNNNKIPNTLASLPLASPASKRKATTRTGLRDVLKHPPPPLPWRRPERWSRAVASVGGIRRGRERAPPWDWRTERARGQSEPGAGARER